MRRRSLMVPASASTPTLISGSANFACSSITMMSVPSTISKPPPQATPLTAAMRGLSRLRGWFKPPNPPAPQSSSDSSPAAAPFRSQPGLKKRSPEPVTIATRSAGSSRNVVNTAFSRRLAARSMAFAFGRSIVTSKTAPRVAVLMPSIAVVSDMSGLLVQADQGVDCHGAAPRREHDHGIQVELDEALEVGGSESRGGERGLDERRDIARRAAAVASEEPGDPQLPDRSGDRGRAEGRQQAHAVAQQLGEHPAGAEREQLPELRIDADADQNLGDTIAHHLLDQHRGGDRGEPLRGRGGLGGGAHVEDDRAELGFVLKRAAGGLDDHREAERLGCSRRVGPRHELRARHPDTEGRERALALGLRERARRGGPGARPHEARPLAAARPALADGAREIERFERLALALQRHDAPGET